MDEEMTRSEILERALKEAEQANIAKTAFLSNMSHEIRTPMNAIIGLNSIALRNPDLPEETRGQLIKIGASAKHLLSLINDILDMSRIESGRVTIRNEDFSFGDMLEEINTMIDAQCDDKGLTYECRVLGNVDDYYIGDDMKLKQVIINILGNAVKFTSKPGTVNFTVEEVSRKDGKAMVRFVMRDTGKGMDKKYLPKIFEPFTQEQEGTSNRYGSTGLGMAITKNIVDLMKGEISVESEPGVGSVFTVTIPMGISDMDKGGDDIEPEKLNVLIVDDDESACDYAKLVLKRIGVSADVCLSGSEALLAYEKERALHAPYNLILTDWRMPEMDGVEFVRQFRSRYPEDDTTVILTTYNWDEIMEEALDAGVDGFVAKPFFAKSIMQQICTIVSQARQSGVHRRKPNIRLNGRHVLLAEDMQINAEIMKQVLKLKEISVDTAENGTRAVELFEKSDIGYYDAILMDIRMPKMNGLEATEAIRAMDREDAKRVPVIALTANAFDEDVKQSLEAGMNAHLSKPVEPDALFDTLSRLVEE